jgi:hypothetical protein
MSTFIDLILVVVALAVAWVAVRNLARFLTWVEKSEIARQKAEAEAERRKAAPPKPAAAPAPEGVPADHVVAIAAAVAAIGYRVVHIDDSASGAAWASEGRWQHQTSHRPH